MGRIRSIKPEFPQSEDIGKLSRDARLLFVQLWTIVDDEGRARAASRMLASLLYPYDSDADALIDGWLGELECEGLIRRYEVNGSRYLDIPNWLKHQKIDHPTKSKIPDFREGSPKPREASRSLAPDQDRIGEEVERIGPRKKDKIPANAGSSPKYVFESGIIRLRQKDFDQWKKAFEHIDLAAELIGLSEWASRQPNWFPAISGALAKRNREIALRVKQNSTFKYNGFEGCL